MLVMSACPYYPTYLFGPTFFLGGINFSNASGRMGGLMDGRDADYRMNKVV